MLFVAPLGIQPDEEAVVAPRRTPVTWSLTVAIALVFACERLAVAAATHGWTWAPEPALRAVTLATAALRLYPDESFAPWQPWSAILTPGTWWTAIAGLLALLTGGRALECRTGSLAFAGVLLVLTPVAGLAAIAWHLRAGGELLVAADPLPALGSALLALALALWPRARVRAMVGWWLVVVVGLAPFRLPLRLVLPLYVLQDLLRLWLGGGPHALITGVRDHLAAIVAAALLAAVLRRARRA